MTGDRDVLCRLPDGTEFPGPVVDFRDIDACVPPAVILDAIRTGCPTRPDQPAVHTPAPTRVHSHVGHLEPDVPIDRRAALAAVGAERGVETPHDADLSRQMQSLREVSTSTVNTAELRAARRRAAEAGSETERLRERVATLRGRVAARRADGGDDALAEAEASLSAATRELSEASTERVAAAQRLATLEDRARKARDAREERFRLEDRVENLRRARRAARADAVEPAFRDARDRLDSVLNGQSEALGGTADTALRDALAVASIARLRAPVVVDPDVVAAFGGPGATFERLDAPLVIG